METRFSKEYLKLSPEEKNILNSSLEYIKDQNKVFEVEIIDKKFAEHFAEIEKQVRQLLKQQQMQEEKKKVEKALDF